LDFPERVYTTEEVNIALELVKKGYQHRLRIKGSSVFKEKVRQALKYVKTAGYQDFLRTYVRSIVEIKGLTQLREAEATIWANNYVVQNPVDAASLFIQKASHMKEYLEGKLYFGGAAETRSVEKRIEFLKLLKKKSRNQLVKDECSRLLNQWDESVFL
jgi:hypothetical protein